MNNRDVIFRDVTLDYLERVNLSNIPSPEQVGEDLFTCINVEINTQNAGRDKQDWIRKTECIPPASLALVIKELNHVKLVSLAPQKRKENSLLVAYNEDGVNAGLYTTEALFELAKRYHFTIDGKYYSELCTHLRAELSIENVQTFHSNYTILNNGIFNHATKSLEPFTPDLVYLSKPKIGYNPNAQNVYIKNPDGTTWDCDSWLQSISFDAEVNSLLWNVINSALRHTTRDKIVLFYAPSGCNGKGTFLALLRNILGEENCVSIPLSQFGERFRTFQLLDCSANLVDENPVKEYAKTINDLKSVATSDVITVEQKHGSFYSLRFHGVQIFCVNSLVRMGDDTDSFYRRVLTVPFPTSFTGRENKLIKKEYVTRKEVLEYFVKKALELGNSEEYVVPKVCEELLGEYKRVNNPISDFLNEILPKLVWELVPYKFLFDCFKVWYKENCTGTPFGRNTFLEKLRQVITSEYSASWTYTPKGRSVPPNGRMNKPEPLIAYYNLADWMNSMYHGNDINEICRPDLKKKYEGLMRL